MSLTHADVSARDTLTQLAGLTGFGWTTSTLIFLLSVIHSGNGPVGRLVAEPQVLLYLGAVLFVATHLLDRHAARRSARRESTGHPVSRSRASRDNARTRSADGQSVPPSRSHCNSFISGPSFS